MLTIDEALRRITTTEPEWQPVIELAARGDRTSVLELAKKVRKVRSAEGSKRYGLPIGSPIVGKGRGKKRDTGSGDDAGGSGAAGRRPDLGYRVGTRENPLPEQRQYLGGGPVATSGVAGQLGAKLGHLRRGLDDDGRPNLDTPQGLAAALALSEKVTPGTRTRSTADDVVLAVQRAAVTRHPHVVYRDEAGVVQVKIERRASPTGRHIVVTPKGKATVVQDDGTRVDISHDALRRAAAGHLDQQFRGGDAPAADTPDAPRRGEGGTGRGATSDAPSPAAPREQGGNERAEKPTRAPSSAPQAGDRPKRRGGRRKAPPAIDEGTGTPRGLVAAVKVAPKVDGLRFDRDDVGRATTKALQVAASTRWNHKVYYEADGRLRVTKSASLPPEGTPYTLVRPNGRAYEVNPDGTQTAIPHDVLEAAITPHLEAQRDATPPAPITAAPDAARPLDSMDDAELLAEVGAARRRMAAAEQAVMDRIADSDEFAHPDTIDGDPTVAAERARMTAAMDELQRRRDTAATEPRSTPTTPRAVADMSDVEAADELERRGLAMRDAMNTLERGDNANEQRLRELREAAQEARRVVRARHAEGRDMRSTREREAQAAADARAAAASDGVQRVERRALGGRQQGQTAERAAGDAAEERRARARAVIERMRRQDAPPSDDDLDALEDAVDEPDAPDAPDAPAEQPEGLDEVMSYVRTLQNPEIRAAVQVADRLLAGGGPQDVADRYVGDRAAAARRTRELAGILDRRAPGSAVADQLRDASQALERDPRGPDDGYTRLDEVMATARRGNADSVRQSLETAGVEKLEAWSAILNAHQDAGQFGGEPNDRMERLTRLTTQLARIRRERKTESDAVNARAAAQREEGIRQRQAEQTERERVRAEQQAARDRERAEREQRTAADRAERERQQQEREAARAERQKPRVRATSGAQQDVARLVMDELGGDPGRDRGGYLDDRGHLVVTDPEVLSLELDNAANRYADEVLYTRGREQQRQRQRRDAARRMSEEARAMTPVDESSVSPEAREQVRGMSDGDLEDAMDGTDMDLLAAAVAEVGRRDELASRRESWDERARRFDELTRAGWSDEDAAEEAYDTGIGHYDRDQVEARLRADGYRGTFHQMAKASFLDEIERIEMEDLEGHEFGVVGVLVSQAGKARGYTNTDMLLGPKREAVLYASEELQRYWQKRGRLTLPEHKARLLGDTRKADNLRRQASDAFE